MNTNEVNRRKVSSKIDEQQAAGGVKAQALASTKTRLLNGMMILAVSHSKTPTMGKPIDYFSGTLEDIRSINRIYFV
jgi:hypothetical protein